MPETFSRGSQTSNFERILSKPKSQIQLNKTFQNKFKQQSKMPGQRHCSRCRAHGVWVHLKGHKLSCPFRNCSCPLCDLVDQRRRIMQAQARVSEVEQTAHGIRG